MTRQKQKSLVLVRRRTKQLLQIDEHFVDFLGQVRLARARCNRRQFIRKAQIALVLQATL